MLVEVDAVGDDDHARIAYRWVQRQRLRQHDHRQRFAAAGRVPDHAACAFAIGEVRDALDSGLDGEILLVAGDLLDAAIVEDELIGEFEQASRAEQGIQRAILRRRQAIPGGVLLVEIAACLDGIIAPVVEPILLGISQRDIRLAARPRPRVSPSSFQTPQYFAPNPVVPKSASLTLMPSRS